jgi:hypothetical protein
MQLTIETSTASVSDGIDRLNMVFLQENQKAGYPTGNGGTLIRSQIVVFMLAKSFRA